MCGSEDNGEGEKVVEEWRTEEEGEEKQRRKEERGMAIAGRRPLWRMLETRKIRGHGIVFILIFRVRDKEIYHNFGDVCVPHSVK